MGAAQYDGRPSPQLAARLDHVVELWDQGSRRSSSPPAASSPATGSPRPRRRPTTSIERGVPAERSARGRAGHTPTSRSQRCADAAATTAGSTAVLLVSDPYHSLRIRLIAEELGLDGVRVADHAPARSTGGERLAELQGGRRRRRRPIIGFDRSALTGSMPERLRMRRYTARSPRLSGRHSVGSGVIGNTADSGSVIQGSIPCSPAQIEPAAPARRVVDRRERRWYRASRCMAPSSSGLGHHPLKVAARVRIP